MIVLGILLVLIAAAIGLLGVWAASQAVGPALTTTIVNASFEVSALMLFVSGMAVMLLLWLGLRLLGSGTRRSVERRRERRELKRVRREQASTSTQRPAGTGPTAGPAQGPTGHHPTAEEPTVRQPSASSAPTEQLPDRPPRGEPPRGEPPHQDTPPR